MKGSDEIVLDEIDEFLGDQIAKIFQSFFLARNTTPLHPKKKHSKDFAKFLGVFIWSTPKMLKINSSFETCRYLPGKAPAVS